MTTQSQLVELLFDLKEGMGSEAYRVLSGALKELDDGHTPLYLVSWAIMDISTKERDGKAKIKHRRRTTLCRLLPDDQAVAAARATLHAMNVDLEVSSNNWYRWLYHSFIPYQMLTRLQSTPGGNIITPCDNNNMLIIFSHERASEFQTLKKRKRNDDADDVDDDAPEVNPGIF